MLVIFMNFVGYVESVLTYKLTIWKSDSNPYYYCWNTEVFL